MAFIRIGAFIRSNIVFIFSAKFPPGVIADLENRGHVVVNTTEGLSVVNAVCKVKDTIEAYSDLRKPGAKAKLFD